MVKLTKQEKKELKLKKAEELKKAQEKEKIQRKKAQIKHEEDMLEFSKSKMDRSWRHFMIKLKLPLYCEEVKTIWSLFDRVMDKKDNILKELQNQMRDADYQQILSLAAFSDSVHSQLEQFHVCLADMGEKYAKDAAKLRERGEKDMSNVQDMKQKAEWSMAILRWAMQSQALETSDHFQGEAVVKYYEKDLMLHNDREELENMLEGRFTFISDLYKEVLKEYFSKTLENRKKLEKLRPKDAMMTKIIIMQERRMGENIVSLKRLRQEFQSYEDGTVMASIRENYKKNRDAYCIAKNKVNSDLKLDKNQFTELVQISNEVEKWLTEVQKKSDQIMTGMRLCSKMQTSLESSWEGKDDQPLFLFNLTPRMNETLKQYESLKKIWALVSEADIVRKSLLDERNHLVKVNLELAEIFKEWMKNHKNQANSLSVPAPGPGTVSVVEAAHEFRKIACGDIKYI